MNRFLLVLAALWALTAPEGASDGRRGNDLYEQGRFQEAAAAYQAGLDALPEDASAAVHAGLLNNLGLARYRQQDFEGAQAAFERARAAASSDAAYARASYNAGNAAAARGNVDEALAFFRETLLADPAHEDARFNYEFVQRRMNQQDPPPPDSQSLPDDIQPSDYARQLKEQAEALVQQSAYAGAAQLMTDGLQRDSTVAAYRDFITRVREVAGIADPSSVDAGQPGNAIQSQ